MSAQPGTNAKPLPLFADLMRAITKRSHPDLLRAKYPEAADRNEKGLQVINGILSTIKAFNSYPPQLIKRIPLTLLPEGDETELLQCSLEIKTGGGECKRALLLAFLTSFFKQDLYKRALKSLKKWVRCRKRKRKRGKRLEM